MRQLFVEHDEARINVNDEATVQVVGTHEFRFTPPRSLHFILRETLTETDAEAYIAFIHQHSAQADDVVLEATIELGELRRVTQSAQTTFIKAPQRYPYNGVAFVGAAFSIRILVEMIIKAGKVVAADQFKFDHKFVNSVAEAELFFEKLRRKQELKARNRPGK